MAEAAGEGALRRPLHEEFPAKLQLLNWSGLSKAALRPSICCTFRVLNGLNQRLMFCTVVFKDKGWESYCQWGIVALLQNMGSFRGLRDGRNQRQRTFRSVGRGINYLGAPLVRPAG